MVNAILDDGKDSKKELFTLLGSHTFVLDGLVLLIF